MHGAGSWQLLQVLAEEELLNILLVRHRVDVELVHVEYCRVIQTSTE
jgi:hypothetical protein